MPSPPNISPPKLSAQQTIDEIIGSFAFFDDWSDRYHYLIDQGRHVPPIKPAWRAPAYQLKGCQATVYFGAEKDAAGYIHYAAEADAAIVQGLIALLLRVYSGRMPAEILGISPDFLTEIGLDKHLSPTRKNGLSSMLQAIRQAALSHS